MGRESSRMTRPMDRRCSTIPGRFHFLFGPRGSTVSGRHFRANLLTTVKIVRGRPVVMRRRRAVMRG